MEHESSNLFRVLFDEGEYVCGSPLSYNKTTKTAGPFENKGRFLTRDFMLGKQEPRLNKKGMEYTPCRPLNFFTINPIRGGETRAQANLSVMRTFLFECDKFHEEGGNLKDSIRAHEILFNRVIKYGLVFSGLVYSGKKSVHGYVTVDCGYSDVAEYKSTWWRLSKLFTKAALELREEGKLSYTCTLPTLQELPRSQVSICDSACCDPIRFSRFPNVNRYNLIKEVWSGRTETAIKLGNFQKLLYVGRRMTKEEFDKILDLCPKNLPAKSTGTRRAGTGGSACSVGGYLDFSQPYCRDLFLVAAPLPVINKLYWFRDNSASEGMHKDIFSFYVMLMKTWPDMTKEYLEDLREDLLFYYLKKVGYKHESMYNNDLTFLFKG